MAIVRCPHCRRRFDPGPEIDEELEDCPDDLSLKLPCPACGEWLRLPEQEPCPALNCSQSMKGKMMAQSRLLDDDDDRPRRKSASRRRADDDYDDEDDDWEDRPRRSRSGRRSAPRKNNPVLTFIGILGIVFLVMILSCGGLLYYGYSQAKQEEMEQIAFVEANRAKAQADDPRNRARINADQQLAESRRKMEEIQQNLAANIDSQRIASDFIRLLRDKNSKDAYQLFSDKLKQKFIDLAAFDEYLTNHPTQWTVAVPTPTNFNTKDPTRRVFTVTNPDRGKIMKFTITMAKVDSKWMVDDLTSDSD